MMMLEYEIKGSDIVRNQDFMSTCQFPVFWLVQNISGLIWNTNCELDLVAQHHAFMADWKQSSPVAGIKCKISHFCKLQMRSLDAAEYLSRFLDHRHVSWTTGGTKSPGILNAMLGHVPAVCVCGNRIGCFLTRHPYKSWSFLTRRQDSLTLFVATELSKDS